MHGLVNDLLFSICPQVSLEITVLQHLIIYDHIVHSGKTSHGCGSTVLMVGKYKLLV